MFRATQPNIVVGPLPTVSEPIPTQSQTNLVINWREGVGTGYGSHFVLDLRWRYIIHVCCDTGSRYMNLKSL